MTIEQCTRIIGLREALGFTDVELVMIAQAIETERSAEHPQVWEHLGVTEAEALIDVLENLTLGD